jgi:hypothetical protein
MTKAHEMPVVLIGLLVKKKLGHNNKYLDKYILAMFLLKLETEQKVTTISGSAFHISK